MKGLNCSMDLSSVLACLEEASTVKLWHRLALGPLQQLVRAAAAEIARVNIRVVERWLCDCTWSRISATAHELIHLLAHKLLRRLHGLLDAFCHIIARPRQTTGCWLRSIHSGWDSRPRRRAVARAASGGNSHGLRRVYSRFESLQLRCYGSRGWPRTVGHELFWFVPLYFCTVQARRPKKRFLFGHIFFNITNVFCAKKRVVLVGHACICPRMVTG